MEEKRTETENQPAVNPATGSPAKAVETPVAEPTTAPSTRRRGVGQKRKASNLSGGNSSNPSTSLSAKRQAREKITAVPFLPIHNGPLTRARLQPNNGGGSLGLDSYLASVGSEGELVAPSESSGAGGLKVEELNLVKEEFEALETKIEAEYEVIRSRDANAHVVPIPSGWFSWTKVHPLEERLLPSFFNGKLTTRTPEIYMEIRNWIMSKFHTNPNTIIELKDLSELSVGDSDAKQEVMEFLDYWGLINYHPFPSTDSTALAVNADEGTEPNSLVDKLYRFEVEESCAQAVSRITPTVPSKLFSDTAITEELAGPEGPPEYHCNSCSADCSRKRYHCQKEADFDLCSECFSSGKFGTYMSPSDFILMEPAEAAGATSSKWTDQETLLLLEALELYKENWSEIAEHVATKTKTQCILHFVQMPIEDTFLDCDDNDADPVSTVDDALAPQDEAEPVENKDVKSNNNQSLPAPVEVSKEDTGELNVSEDTGEPNVSKEIGEDCGVKKENGVDCTVKKENGENCAVKALREAFEAVGSLSSDEDNLSFAEAGNPVMALAAFLVRLADPTDITAAAHSSLKLISASDSNVHLAARHCFLLEDPPSDNKKSTNSESDTPDMIEEGSKDDKSKSVLDNVIKSSNDQDNDNNKDSVTKEGILVPSNDLGANELGAAPQNEPDNPNMVKEQAAPSSTSEKSNLVESSTKGSGDGSPVGPSQSSEAPKDENMISDPLEKKEPEKPVESDMVQENAADTVDEEAKDSKTETEDPLETKNELDLEKLKRAAITAISAAAVKSKLLATQEEDQIRELATSLIEKQLHKLETKLSFFNEMESVVMRAREQMERSRQKLFHERSQIIAARLGVSAPSYARPVQPSLPVNRAAMAFANSAQRPPIGMPTAQRPPISRSNMAPAAAVAPSSLGQPATVAGNSVMGSSQDKAS